jgi:hypothetical protein
MSASSNVAAKKWARTVHDILKKSYWVIGLIILGFSTYFYYTGLNRPVAGVLWFVGGFLIFYYYWIKILLMNCSKLMIIKIHKIYFMLIFWLYKFDVTKKFRSAHNRTNHTSK